MKRSCFSLFAGAAVMLTAAGLTLTSSAQAPQGPPGPPPGGGPPHSFPAPTNLKVLPKSLTGQQVHEIMETWAGSLGVHCSTCHAADPKNLGPNGKPRLNFADDSKGQKRTARQMFKMTEGINTTYIAKVPDVDMDKKVTCGMCHRGHLDPEPYVIPEEEHGPPPAGGPGGVAPPAQH